MARTSNSSSDEGGGDYSRRRNTDRKTFRRRRSYSASGSESPSGVNSSDSEMKRGRKRRGSSSGEDEERRIEDRRRKRVEKSRKERFDSSSGDELDRKRDRRGKDETRRKEGVIKEDGIKDKEKRTEDTRGKRVEKSRSDSSSDDELDRKKDRRINGEKPNREGVIKGVVIKEDGEVSDSGEDVGRGRREEARKDKILGREKRKNYYSDSGSDDSGKIVERRRKENGGGDRERGSRRDKEVDGRPRRRGDDDEGTRKFRERDDEKRVERHRNGRGKDDDRYSSYSKRYEKGSPSSRYLEDGDDKDDRKERRAIDERDDNRHRRRDDGRHRGGREARDDDKKEWRNDRDSERRRGYDDERDHRRRNGGEGSNNVRDEVERDNQRGREREADGIVSEDPRAQRPEVNLNTDTGNLGRSGGVYIPPFKLARMMNEVEDKSSTEYQRMTWDALRKSINGLVNKVNSTNAKNIIPELFAENLIRGRGLFCQSCMKSQMASPGFTDVFASLVAVVNTKFPEVGDLLLRRIILQLQRAFKRNDKHSLLAAVKFIAHLVNQQVVHELIALELLTLLLKDPTDDSVEVAVGFVTECGAMLQDLSPRGLHAIFERFRGILHEGEIDKRVQFLIEGLFALRKAKFQNYPAVRPELDLVELEDQITHEISLSADIDPELSCNLFKPDPQFLENEKRYEDLKKQILGEESEDDDEESGEESDEDSEEESDEDDEEQMQIKDETETNLVNLRRTIYLTIMSSVDFEEAGHKLLKIKLEPGQEMELCIMLLECCCQERTYLRYYGLLGQRFCMINKVHQENFEKCFVQQYSMIHRHETNKLRNVAKFFAHLLGTDALPWHVLAYIRLTEEDTTSSSRIFIKILFQELSEHLGIRLLNERLNDPTMQESLDSIFPKDNPKNTRFAINFFTSIGLGGITENLREYLKNMPRLIMQQQKPPQSESEEDSSGSESDSGSSSSSSSSDESESESESDGRRKRRRRR
ncbi:hypothetical protein Leryth_003871 [Lithospermum erythrorhizon]|nr:hypothetical protein Leryth_003871 [Lithospermum erythrorhizon]